MDQIAKAQQVLAKATVFIADGHHRYETALDYQCERSASGANPSAAWNSVMMMLVNLDTDGLTILPTHRVLHGVPTPDWASIRSDLEQYFIVCEEQLSSGSEAGRRGQAFPPGTFGVYLGAGRLWVVTRRDAALIRDAMTDERSVAWKDLDVAILHRLVLERALGLSRESLDSQENVRYTRDAEEACLDVDDGKAIAAFLLPAPGVEAVRDVALADDVMPHKSTYFYPKLLTGLMFSDLNARLGR